MQIIGIRIRKAGKILYYSPGEYEVARGDSVIVETSRGIECCKVIVGPLVIDKDETFETEPGIPLRRIRRKATESDLSRLEANHADEKRAFEICLQKIKEHDLPMKLINVEYTFDVNKIMFFFTAEGRVDFRMLVRDLAAVFRTRIELRQVGVRDEAKILGGTGGCGRPLCCASFLGDFVPVSIRMAKDQNLSLNPTKISGICGRLMCCLKFENENYCGNCQIQHNVTFRPRPGVRVVIDDGEGKVIAVNYLRRNATILLHSNRTVVANWEDILPAEGEEFVAENSLQVESVDETVEVVEETQPPKSEQLERPRKSEAAPTDSIVPERKRTDGRRRRAAEKLRSSEGTEQSNRGRFNRPKSERRRTTRSRDNRK